MLEDTSRMANELSALFKADRARRLNDFKSEAKWLRVANGNRKGQGLPGIVGLVPESEISWVLSGGPTETNVASCLVRVILVGSATGGVIWAAYKIVEALANK